MGWSHGVLHEVRIPVGIKSRQAWRDGQTKLQLVIVFPKTGTGSQQCFGRVTWPDVEPILLVDADESIDKYETERESIERRGSGGRSICSD